MNKHEATNKSFYRGWSSLQTNDDDVTVTRPGFTRRSRNAAKVADYSAMRLSRPIDKLVPRTVDWILALPPAVRPHVLAAKYARIVNQLCVSWAHPAECSDYLDELVTDRRGGRQGFAPWIAKELVTLRRYYAQLHPLPGKRTGP